MSRPAGAPLRVGVLGTGRIGRMHAELLATRVPGLELASVYDAAPGAAEGLRAPVAADRAELFASVDAVAVCSSTDTHADLVVAAAEAGKAIFCEKPISLELAEVDRALAAVARAGVPFQVGFNRRFDPSHRAVRDAVAAGEVGEPHLLRITSRDPEPPPLDYVRASGGLFLDMTIHDFDMARFVAGSEIVEVYARGAARVDPAIGEAGDVDTAVLALEHANGVFTVIDNSRRAAYGYDQRVEAFGSAGMAASDNVRAHMGVVRTATGSRTPPLPWFFLERYAESYLRAWEAFAAALREGTEPPVTGADGRAALLAGLAAARSLRERRAVRLATVDTYAPPV